MQNPSGHLRPRNGVTTLTMKNLRNSKGLEKRMKKQKKCDSEGIWTILICHRMTPVPVGQLQAPLAQEVVVLGATGIASLT
jgi:hypothetical protein